jgi:hypothetical protein
MTDDLSMLLLSKDIRSSWQARCLHAAKDDKFWNVVHAVMWHSYGRAMPVLLQLIYSGFTDITRPFFIGGANVLKNGKVACRLIKSGSDVPEWVIVYDHEHELIKAFRDLADELKLNDKERVELTGAVKRWVVADLRVDHLGRKVVAA